MLERIQEIDTAAIEELSRIKRDQEVLEDRLHRMSERKEGVSEIVFERVRGDYRTRLQALDDEARPLKEAARGEYAKLQALLAEIQRTRDETQLEKEELEFRHTLGEFADGVFEERVAECADRLSHRQAELGEVEALRGRFVASFRSPEELEIPAPEPEAAEPAASEPGPAEPTVAEPAAVEASAAAVEAASGDSAPAAEPITEPAAEEGGEEVAAADETGPEPTGEWDTAAGVDAPPAADGGGDSAGAGTGHFPALASGRTALGPLHPASFTPPPPPGAAADLDDSGEPPTAINALEGEPPTAMTGLDDRAAAPEVGMPAPPVASYGEPTSLMATPIADAAALASGDGTLVEVAPPLAAPAPAAAAAEDEHDDAWHEAPTGSFETPPIPDSVPRRDDDIDDDVLSGATRILARPRFVEMENGAAGREHILAVGRTSIGRASDNLVHLLDEAVSRHHAEVLPGPDGYVVRDLGSENGIYVNGERLREWVLHEGDVVQIGSRTLVYHGA